MQNNQFSSCNHRASNNFSRNSVILTRVRIDPWIFLANTTSNHHDDKEYVEALKAVNKSINGVKSKAIELVSAWNNSQPLALKLALELGSECGLRVIGVWDKVLTSNHATGKLDRIAVSAKIQLAIQDAILYWIAADLPNVDAQFDSLEVLNDKIINHIFTRTEFKVLAETGLQDVFEAVLDKKLISRKFAQYLQGKRMALHVRNDKAVLPDWAAKEQFLDSVYDSFMHVATTETIADELLSFEQVLVEQANEKVIAITCEIEKAVEAEYDQA